MCVVYFRTSCTLRTRLFRITFLWWPCSPEIFKIGVRTNIKNVFLLSEVPSKHTAIYAHVEIEIFSKKKIALDLLYVTERTSNSSKVTTSPPLHRLGLAQSHDCWRHKTVAELLVKKCFKNSVCIS